VAEVEGPGKCEVPVGCEERAVLGPGAEDWIEKDSTESWAMEGDAMLGVAEWVSARLCDEESEPDAASSVFAGSPLLSSAFSLPFFPFPKTSRGKSAIAMVKAPTSPINAARTAEIGSQGCSSVLYSIERYLENDEPCA
jgi:hypothetical protein